MAIITFKNGDFSIDKPLYQWDKNITLKIKGLTLPSTPEIHFSNSSMGGAIVKTATVEDDVVVVTIPNGLLQVINNLKVYVCFYQGEEFTTDYRFILEITPREKPNDYSIQDDEDVYSFNELKTLVENYNTQADNKIQEAKDQIDAEIHRVEAQANANYETVNERVNNLVATDPGSTGDNAELLDIRVGSDGKTYPTAGDAVRVQVSELKSNLSNSNLINIFEKKITTTTDKWDRPISFRHVWFPFTAKSNYSIKSVSFNALVNNPYLDSGNAFCCELLKNDGSTVIASSSSDYDWVDNSTFVSFMFDLNGVVQENESYYLHIYCLTRSFSYAMVGYMNKYEDDYILSCPPTKASSDRNATFATTGTNDTIRLSVTMNISGKNISDISKIEDDVESIKSDISKIEGISPIKVFVAKNGSDTTGDGSKENPYATMYFAHESITDSSINKPYVIIVGEGTYTDLQEKYAGDITTGSYKGINVKDHIYFESEDVEHPERTILEWDGFSGFTDETYTEKIRSDMCLFHFNGRKASRKWASSLKGFTLKGSNTRYLFHIEANSDQNILIENCIFDWGGTPKGQYHNIPVVGCGGSYNQTVTFKNCILKNSESTAGVQWHDNAYPYSDLNIYHGADFNFIGCQFNGLDLQMRSTNADREMPFSLTVEKCGGIRKAVFSQGGGATKNYWRGQVISSLIAEDKISNATDETNEVTPFELK